MSLVVPGGLSFTPEQASSMAGQVDELFGFLTVFSFLLALAIALLIVYFATRYRRRPERPRGVPIHGSWSVELTWVIVPTIISLLIFYRGAKIYVQLVTPPPQAMEIYVVAKQWMWKFQHAEGPLEQGELHVPVGRDVKLTLATEDVIHSFFIPAFRIKTDVVPGRYRTVWFRAIRAGTYHLFCAEYCGTSHSAMRGTVIALPPAEYQRWLTLGRSFGTLAGEGEKLFEQLACSVCHRRDSQGRGPVLDGVYGSQVALRDGQTVLADEGYLRESIVAPDAKIVAGFDPIMPSFRGLLDEEQVLALIGYIRSLGAPPAVVPQQSHAPLPTRLLPRGTQD